MKKRLFRMLLTVGMAVSLFVTAAVPAGAVSIGDSSVFVKQKSSDTCTLASAVMMLRRKAILNGDSEWKSITESAVKPKAWSSGLKWDFTYHGMTVKTYGVKSDLGLNSTADKKEYFITALKKHPEGIVVYNHSEPHAVLLTRYDADAGRFYCSDPATNADPGEIALKKCFIPGKTQNDVLANINQIWLITKDTNKKVTVPCSAEHCGTDGVCRESGCSNYGKLFPYTETPQSMRVVTVDYAYVQSQPYGDSAYRLRTVEAGTALSVLASAENIHGMEWYRIGDGEWVCSDRCRPGVQSVSLDMTDLTLYIGDRTVLAAAVCPDDAPEPIVWSSSDSSVARVENGVVTAVSAGGVTVTASAGGQSAVCFVTVESLEDAYVCFPDSAVYRPGQFADVPQDEWYADSVARAYGFGLMKGDSATAFRPEGEVTLAEAITMAARIHSIYSTGSESFRQDSGEAWYRCYLDYAYENDVIDYSYYNRDPDVPATRAQYADIFAHALPAEALAEINAITDGAIPDVSLRNRYAASIYRLYRAGILTGGDEKGTFAPNDFITRAESAAIVSRMASSAYRVHFSLDA